MIPASLRTLIGGQLDKLRQKSGRPLRFMAAGAFNAAMGLTLFPALLLVNPYFRVHYIIALIISQFVCTTVAFVIYKLLVFRTKGNVAREFVSFVSFYLINYAANWLFLPLLVEFGGFNPIWAQMVFVVILAVSSYFWHSRISFQSPRLKESAE
jgi:putative flippase GtrA